MSERVKRELSQLGRSASIPENPDKAVLETFENPHPDVHYVVRLKAPEFTCLCPITGQPDFATIIVDYVPGKWILESKSFKLFLGSFRNTGIFHEDGTVYIHKRLKEALDPVYLRVIGFWNVRGGISIDVAVESGRLPENCRPLPIRQD
ncbi:preQ(1) synthase [Thermodesulforhabdus norvegica]|uniref:NADPH-dependent 7-cyano-7-deazaguanine reductase n=1 Tax=Thermodesulforhabdus norvegica TaxID=39841 RepID=A0A1I4SMH7_9BACT|nr:preQ(1) synthase [Thermodesulforhabdus norvegica]SFM65634.1 7-cyano-7-deazaguanine reductase [Thermodesulforhabdus norvegica]